MESVVSERPLDVAAGRAGCEGGGAGGATMGCDDGAGGGAAARTGGSGWDGETGGAAAAIGTGSIRGVIGAGGMDSGSTGAGGGGRTVVGSVPGTTAIFPLEVTCDGPLSRSTAVGTTSSAGASASVGSGFRTRSPSK
jgi:hypothetical protein